MIPKSAFFEFFQGFPFFSARSTGLLAKGTFEIVFPSHNVSGKSYNLFYMRSSDGDNTPACVMLIEKFQTKLLLWYVPRYKDCCRVTQNIGSRLVLVLLSTGDMVVPCKSTYVARN